METCMMQRGRAQIRMSESIAIMIVFFILVVFGFIFYSKIEMRNINVQKSEVQELKAVEVAQVFSFLPEIQCTRENVVTSNCVDIMKLQSMNALAVSTATVPAEFADYYYDQLLRSSIMVKEIYPNPENSWLAYNYSGNNNFRWTKKVATQIPVAIFNATGDPVSGKPPYFAFGVIEVEVYS